MILSIEITRKCETIEDCEKFYEIVKYSLKDFNDVHVKGHTKIYHKPSRSKKHG